MILQGKGLWAWRLWELEQALMIAPAMGITHVLYKVGQGPLGSKPGFVIAALQTAAQRIRQAGYTPFAWSFTTLGDPDFEAQMVVDAFTAGFEGFVFNAEGATEGRREAAIALGEKLHAANVDLDRLYLCSYPTPLTHHAGIPFNEMGPYCKGGLMPMAYGTYLQPPEIVIGKWTYEQNTTWMAQQGLQLPIYPVLGPYLDNLAQQPMSQEVLQTWLDCLAGYAPTFFSLYTTAALIPEHFAPIRAFVLGSPPPLAPAAWIHALGGVVLFASAGNAASRFASLVYGTEVELLGSPTTAGGQRWQRVRAGRLEGWLPEVQLQSSAPGPWPALAPPPTPPAGHLLTVWSTDELNTRSDPVVRPTTLVGRIPKGTRLKVVEGADKALQQVGKVGHWLHVQVEPEGPTVWVAAWYLSPHDPLAPATPGLRVRVHNPEEGYLAIRNGPSSTHDQIGQAPHGSVLFSLESDAETQRKVGQEGDWLRMVTPNGLEGYVAAWYLRPYVRTTAEVRYVLVESPQAGVQLRAAPDPEAAPGWWVPHATVLESLEAPDVTADKLEQFGAWLQVRTPSRREGYVPVRQLRAPEVPDTRQPTNDAKLPYGRSAWLFGMHAADIADDTPEQRRRIRQLFESSGKRGWILFTQAIGSNPAMGFNEELRQRLWDWSRAGYGVIVRLNHSYYPSGTLPDSPLYDAFAATCARWVELYLKHDEEPASRYTWILQIGNEPNNPSEHPGDVGVIRENITPQLYARAFNKVYAAVKRVLPQAYVAPAAIDPYNSTPMQLVNRRYRPLEYFQELLDAIPALDAFILHAYTHGPSVSAITSLTSFADFMTDHYFDFQTYRQFMERIPARWKQVPVIIGETNHLCRAPGAPGCEDPAQQGWINANINWVRAVYQEIHRWNSIPYIQQIHGVLLYRWSGDQWELHNKDQILLDFTQAMGNDYRWRS
ncbi:MAG TPA: SH3 domain-containing protein [Anaerolineae bacterium]|nr:SH3 domain-containing protein [Anaerolineae bacterium]